MNKETGGPAFPSESVYARCEACGWDENSSVPGMTLRDYFAAKAMQALVSYDMRLKWERIAETAYEIADAMIAERAREK